MGDSDGVTLLLLVREAGLEEGGMAGDELVDDREEDVSGFALLLPDVVPLPVLYVSCALRP